jgi:hypothetical protein
MKFFSAGEKVLALHPDGGFQAGVISGFESHPDGQHLAVMFDGFTDDRGMFHNPISASVHEDMVQKA